MKKYLFTLFIFSYSMLSMAQNANSIYPKDENFSLPTLKIGKEKDGFQKSMNFGAVMHLQSTLTQDTSEVGRNRWQRQFRVYRMFMFAEAKISPKTSAFIEFSALGAGTVSNDGTKDTEVTLSLLDAQVEHKFAKEFGLVAGLQLVGNTRNALQSSVSLMGMDFGVHQYPYNLFETSPLQGFLGRDVGLNARGFLFNEKLEYRLGVFSGRNFDGYDPLRIVGRLNYNFLDKETDFYYTGTTLGEKKIFALGGGVDIQNTYYNFALDTFLDVPLGNAGSVTLSGAFSYLTGGEEESGNTLTTEIPQQTIHFLELGYYFKKIKLQPYVKYENQIMNGKAVQYGLTNTASSDIINDFDTLNSSRRLGLGVNYFFEKFNGNLKLLYENIEYGKGTAGVDTSQDSFNQIWLQLQFFIF